MRAHILLLGAAMLFSSLSASPPVQAEEPWGLSLLDDDSFVGWEDDESEENGWTLEQGVLRCNAIGETLSSTWSFDELELLVEWTVRDAGRWELEFHPEQVPTEDGIILVFDPLVVSFQEGDHCGQVTEHGVLAPGVTVPASNGTRHVAKVRRFDEKLSVAIDGGESQVIDVSGDWRDLPLFSLRLTVAAGTVEISSLRFQEPEGEPLVKANSLEGWWTPGNLDSWQVEGDTITCLNRDGNYLRTEKEFGDFTLSLEYKLAAGGNSGIGIRTPREGWPSGDGMELQLLDEPPDAPLTRHSTMALYGNLEPLARADRSEEWNRLTVRTAGGVVAAWVNGVLVQHADVSSLPELRRRRLRGWIGIQDHGARIAVRNLRVYEPPYAAQPIVEDSHPFMRFGASSELLAGWPLLGLSDPLWLAPTSLSGLRPLPLPEFVVHSIAKAGERQTILDVQNPGAVLRIARTNNSGRLAFYFDGEAEPRIDCPASELHAHLPQVCEDRNPLLTSVPFANSLRVEIVEGEDVSYRFDCVRFVETDIDESVYSFFLREPWMRSLDPRNPDQSIPRGILPALVYRSEQFGWGVHREHDPDQRFDGNPRSISPGEAVTLLSVKGYWELNWFKLRAATELLADDRLWLQVRIDGEEQPSISAPARYLFPGLAGGNYPNFMHTNRDGFTSLLPLECQESIEFIAVNRGPTEIADVVLSVSAFGFPTGLAEWLEADGLADDVTFPPASRLRAIFQPADEAGDGILINAAGRGRLIGFIHEPLGDTPLESLTVDGVEQPGWAAENMDLLLGMAAGETEARRALSGRYGGLEWVYLLLTPVDFQESLVLKAPAGTKRGGRLALLYME